MLITFIEDEVFDLLSFLLLAVPVDVDVDCCMCVMAREVTDDVNEIAVVVKVATFRADVPMIARMEDLLVLFS